jgi:hypothetical protein
MGALRVLKVPAHTNSACRSTTTTCVGHEPFFEPTKHRRPFARSLPFSRNTGGTRTKRRSPYHDQPRQNGSRVRAL